VGLRRKAPEERRTLDTLFNAAYEELRRLASAVKRSDANATLSPTTLVNEAWLKLASAPEFASQSHLHFKRIAAQAMRQILIDAARRRSAQKRGGQEAIFVAFGD
jgi:RNA polymerase sigma factor (TIGR02999 family)